MTPGQIATIITALILLGIAYLGVLMIPVLFEKVGLAVALYRHQLRCQAINDAQARLAIRKMEAEASPSVDVADVLSTRSSMQ